MTQGREDRSERSTSRLHERRRADLDTFARHLGFEIPTAFPDGLFPDVTLGHRLCPRRLFVGDAKDTEHPRTKASRARLLAYLLRLDMRWGPHALAIACRLAHASPWSEALVELVSDAGLRVRKEPWIRPLSQETAVVVVLLSPD